jgi:hypothetical protein
MKLFRRPPSYPWQPSWRLDPGAVLWRLKFSNTGRILGEARDPESKTSWFFCCLLWNDLHLEEPWWIGLEDIADGRFYLHGFRKPDMPQHLGIFAYDLDTGTSLWNNSDLAYLFAFDGSVFASEQRFDGSHVLRLSSADGTVAEELGIQNSSVNTMRAILNEQDIFVGYRYPEHFDETHPSYHELRERIHAVVDPAAVTGNLDVLQEEDLLLISWHERLPDLQSSLKQEFAAVDSNSGAILFRDTIVEKASAPGVDSFFVKDSLLYYIKNYRTLTAHDLARLPV